MSGAVRKVIEKNTWCVYMVSCSDGTLYTGITNDLKKRIEAHNSGRDGARYTRARRPVKLVYADEGRSKSASARLEYRIKRLPRLKKKELVQGKDCGWMPAPAKKQQAKQEKVRKGT